MPAAAVALAKIAAKYVARKVAADLLRAVWKPLLTTILVLFLLQLVLLAVVINTLIPRAQAGTGPSGRFAQSGGPLYSASTTSLGLDTLSALRAATIRDLGFGPSDAARIDRMIAAIRPDSPLVGQGALILRLGQTYGVDPLLIALWQAESQMATDGLNIPANGNWNGGNMVWEAAEPYAAAWGCSPGRSSLGHRWALCPTADGGLGLWFQYVGTSPVYARAATFSDFVNIYNPCSDPENARNGFPCGDVYGGNILSTIRTHAGRSSVSLPGGECEAALSDEAPGPEGAPAAADNLTLPSAAGEIMRQVFGGRQFPITQGWGHSDLSGEPTYLGYRHFHRGIDFGVPSGTAIYAPAGGVADQRTGHAGNLIVSLALPNGYTFVFMHLDRQIAAGSTPAGAPIGLTGNTGYSTGAHLHLELISPSGQWVPPEQWGCVGIQGQRQ